MVPTTSVMSEIAEQSEMEHLAGQKYQAAKPHSVSRLFWKLVYIFSRQELDRLISINMEKTAAQIKASHH